MRYTNRLKERSASTTTVTTSTGISPGHEILVFVITLLILLWPLAINGAPLYAADSASYLRGGDLGFHAGLQILARTGPATQGAALSSDPRKIVTGAIAKSGGARSAIYSVAVYLLRGPNVTLIALVIMQSAGVAFVASLLRRSISPESGIGPAIAAGAMIGILTSAPWYSAYAMPDILAGILISAVVVLTLFFERIGTWTRMVLVLLIAFGIAVHGSHLPIAVVTLIAGAIVGPRPRARSESAIRRTAWFASPVLIAVIAMLGTSYVAFGEFSLAPKRYPIQLARSVADGPGAWYLRDHCDTDHYAICEVFGPNPPTSVHEFLWGENGVRKRATPAQMDRIRAEEGTIVRRATLAYPAVQIRRSATNAFLQLFEFGPHELTFDGRMVRSGEDVSVQQIGPDRPLLKAIGKVLIYLSFTASILLLAVVRRRLARSEIAVLFVVAAGLGTNAAVCGILSGVADRYQGRVAWVLPAVAVMIFLRVRAGRGSNATTPKVALA